MMARYLITWRVGSGADARQYVFLAPAPWLGLLGLGVPVGTSPVFTDSQVIIMRGTLSLVA